MPLIAAKCTQCGANIEVDDSKEAGICQACGTPFITEKAINYFNQSISIDKATINIQGVDVNNLLLRAQQFEIEGDIDKAKEYYNKVLDIDINNPIAIVAMDKIKNLDSIVIAGKMVPVSVINKIDAFLKEGLKIKAINELREATGVGFKEANDAVSSYAYKKGYIDIHPNTSNTSSRSQTQLLIFIFFMLFGLVICFSGKLYIFSLVFAAICGLGILYGLMTICLMTQFPIDFEYFSMPRTIWSFCAGFTIGLIFKIYMFFNP